jgi:hypothetical protein
LSQIIVFLLEWGQEDMAETSPQVLQEVAQALSMGWVIRRRLVWGLELDMSFIAHGAVWT